MRNLQQVLKGRKDATITKETFPRGIVHIGREFRASGSDIDNKVDNKIETG